MKIEKKNAIFGNDDKQALGLQCLYKDTPVIITAIVFYC